MREIMLSVAIILIGAVLYAQEAPGPIARQELDNALRNMNIPTNQDTQLRYTGILKPTDEIALKSIQERFPNSAEARTAELWLNMAQMEAEERDRTISRKAKMLQRSESFERLAQKAFPSWQAKAARLARCGALLSARDYEGLKGQVGDVLKNVKDYTSEADGDYLLFLKAFHADSTDIEPTLRRMLIVGACHANKLDEALLHAQELQKRFPEWSKWKHIGSDIEQLQRGEVPYPPR